MRRLVRLFPLSVPGLSRQSAPEPARALRLDARVMLRFQSGHGAPDGDPGTGHDKRQAAAGGKR